MKVLVVCRACSFSSDNSYVSVKKQTHKTPLFLGKKNQTPNQNSCWKRTVERKHLEEMPVQFQSCLQDNITYVFQDVILCFIRQHHNEIIPLNMDSRPPLWSMVIIMSDSASWEYIRNISHPMVISLMLAWNPRYAQKLLLRKLWIYVKMEAGISNQEPALRCQESCREKPKTSHS